MENKSEEYKCWHNIVGHISSERYQILSKTVGDVSQFPRSITKDLHCIPYITGKMHKSPVKDLTTPPPSASEIHLDLSGPFKPSFNNNKYAAHLLDSRSAFSEVHAIPSKGDVSLLVQSFIAKVNNKFAQHGGAVQMIRADNARENLPNELMQFCMKNGISVQPSPPYAPESNGMAERLVQEHWTRASVLMLSTTLPAELWDEEIKHASWLRNSLPSSRINFSIPLLKWNSDAKIRFRKLPEFEAMGFAFIYYPKNVLANKLLPRSEQAHFLGIEGDERMIRVFIPETKAIRRLRRAAFHLAKYSPLPSLSSFLDGISRQRIIEEEHQVDNEQPEAILQASLASIRLNENIFNSQIPEPFSLTSRLNPHKSYTGISDGPPLLKSFQSACLSKDWAAAINREYNSTIKRGTWKYAKGDPNHPPVPFKWTFREKQLNEDGQMYLFKARCVLRGDLQTEGLDFDPEELYAPAASHEAIRLFFSVTASEELDAEGCDVDSAYLFGDMDVPIRMKQPTDSSQIIEMEGYDCLLVKSIYGSKQAGRVWNNTLKNTLLNWKFIQSRIEQRIYYFVIGNAFIILCVFVDYIEFASKNTELMAEFKSRISAQFSVKIYGKLKYFIRWTITQTLIAITVTQEAYCRRFLARFNMSNCNPVSTPLPTNVDLNPRYETELPLSPSALHTFRSIIGGIAYLESSTRPDLSFTISSLSRSLHSPSSRHLELSKRILRYIKGTSSYGLTYHVGRKIIPPSMRAAVDADWGGYTHSRKSTPGYIFAVNGSPIFWKSKLQTVVALSSGESEYVAMSACIKDVLWLRRLVYEMVNRKFCDYDSLIHPTPIEADSSAAMSIASNKSSTKLRKHIALRFHHVRDNVHKRFVQSVKVSTDYQVTDPLTKPSTINTLNRLIFAFGLNVAKVSDPLQSPPGHILHLNFIYPISQTLQSIKIMPSIINAIIAQIVWEFFCFSKFQPTVLRSHQYGSNMARAWEKAWKSRPKR